MISDYVVEHKTYCSSCKRINVPLVKKSRSRTAQYYMCRSCNTERLKKYRQTEQGKEAVKNANANYYSKNASRINQTYWKARTVEQEACEVCGEEKADRHHFDYLKPLDVVFLCRAHHKEVHKKLKISKEE